MSEEVTYKSGLYFINTQEGRVGYRKEIRVSSLRFYITNITWYILRLKYESFTINNTKILKELDNCEKL